MNLQVSIGEAPSTIKPLELSVNKRLFDHWPFYRSKVYKDLIERGEVNHATRVGLARSLAFEGDSQAAFIAIGEAIYGMEEDSIRSGKTWGGIDWELGFALYENFGRYNNAELSTFWSSVPKTEAWLGIVTRATELYGRYWPKDTERIKSLGEGQKLLYVKAKLPNYKTRCMANHIANLERRAERANTEKERQYYEKLAQNVRVKLANYNQ